VNLKHAAVHRRVDGSPVPTATFPHHANDDYEVLKLKDIQGPLRKFQNFQSPVLFSMTFQVLETLDTFFKDFHGSVATVDNMLQDTKHCSTL